MTNARITVPAWETRLDEDAEDGYTVHHYDVPTDEIPLHPGAIRVRRPDVDINLMNIPIDVWDPIPIEPETVESSLRSHGPPSRIKEFTVQDGDVTVTLWREDPPYPQEGFMDHFTDADHFLDDARDFHADGDTEKLRQALEEARTAIDAALKKLRWNDYPNPRTEDPTEAQA